MSTANQLYSSNDPKTMWFESDQTKAMNAATARRMADTSGQDAANLAAKQDQFKAVTGFDSRNYISTPAPAKATVTSKGATTQSSTLGVQKAGKVSTPSSSKSSSKSSSIDYEKQRKDAQKALEKQYGLQAEGANTMYNGGLEQLQNLMAQLDPTYAKYQTDYQTTLDQNKQKDLQGMQAQFAAYGTGDSEQRTQSQERMNTDYQKQLSDFLSQLDSQKNSQRMGYDNQRIQLQSERDKAVSDAKAGRYAGESQIDQSINKQIADAQQQQFDNNIKLATLAKTGAGAQGFSAQQQQAITSQYSKDLQSALGKAAYMPSGGREAVYNQMVTQYGNVLDPQSIYDDIFNNFAQNGWEDQYKSVNKNPTTDPYAGLAALLGQGN